MSSISIGIRVSVVRAAALTVMATLAGCVTVPPATGDAEARARQFVVPPGKAVLYVYRISGRTSLREVLVDGYEVGGLVAGMYLYAELEPGRHEVSATGAMNTASLVIQAAAGKAQFVKLNTPDNHWGVYISHSKLILMPDATGREVVAHSHMAVSKPVPVALR